MLQKIRWFSLILGTFLLLIIAFQNRHLVELDLLLFRGEYSLTLLLIVTAAVGFLGGSLTTFWMLRSRA